MPEVGDKCIRDSGVLLHDISPVPKPPSGTMRKYQQLALTAIAAISLVAFLFYKHEYERLRYTLQYLDTFGEPPGPSESELQCGSNTHHPLSTPPADWIQVTKDLQLYSAFWDEQNGIGEPRIRVLGVSRVSTEPPQDLGCLVWFESEIEPVVGTCSVEAAEDRSHGHSTSGGDVTVLFLVCSADDTRLMLSQTPHQIQIKVGAGEASNSMFLHQTEALKSVAEKTTICVTPPSIPMATLRVVEFIAHHHGLGADRFVMYGGIMSPLARKLMDMYGDQLGLQYEEKMFNPAVGFPLTPEVVRVVVEMDCVYRHRDTQENVVVLGLDQYLLLPHQPTIQSVLATMGAARRAARDLSQFHLMTQRVCLDHQHGLNQGAALIMARPVHTAGQPQEAGVAILRPHLMATTVMTSPASSQHVSATTITVCHFVTCSTTDTAQDSQLHQDTQHLPTNKKYVAKLRKNLLYRKWVINS